MKGKGSFCIIKCRGVIHESEGLHGILSIINFALLQLADEDFEEREVTQIFAKLRGVGDELLEGGFGFGIFHLREKQFRFVELGFDGIGHNFLGAFKALPGVGEIAHAGVDAATDIDEHRAVRHDDFSFGKF